MIRNEKNGVITLHESEGFGGSSFNAVSLSSFFPNMEKPHHFGLMVSKLFSTSSRFHNKPLTMMTLGRNNYTMINGSTYRWQVGLETNRRFYVKEVIETSTRPGFGGQEFEIVLDKGWLHQPDVIMADNNKYILEIIGYPKQYGTGWKYRVRLMTGDLTRYMPASEFAVNKSFTKVFTSTPDENNRIGGTTQFGTQTELESQIGYFAEEFSVSDKLVRREAQARKAGIIRPDQLINRDGSYSGYAAFSGYSFSLNVTDPKTGANKVIPQGGFISYMEADLMDRIVMGRELAAHFGQYSKRLIEGDVLKRTSPGIREIMKDGHTLINNGSLQISELEDWIHSIFLGKVDEGNRDIVLVTGSLGFLIFDRMVSAAAFTLNLIDTQYIRQIGEPGILEYGYQFKSYKGKNGVSIRLMMNPIFDNPLYCRTMHPLNPRYTIDSARMEIWDFGASRDSMAPGASNMTMIMESLTDEYYWICNAVDPVTGVINDGRTISNQEKGCRAYMATSGGVQIWDTSRTGFVEYSPEAYS